MAQILKFQIIDIGILNIDANNTWFPGLLRTLFCFCVFF